MPCFEQSTIRDFILVPHGSGSAPGPAELRIESQTPEGFFSGHRYVNNQPKEYFAGRCLLLDGTTNKTVSFILPIDNAVYFFAGTIFGNQSGDKVNGAYIVIARFGNLLTPVDTEVLFADPGDTGTWGGTQT